MTEGDWKYLRSLHDELLEKLAQRINDRTRQILATPGLAEDKKRHQVYRHMKDSDHIIARCFDDWRRSTLLLRLLAIHREGLLTEEQFAHLSPMTQESLKALA